MIMSCLKQKLQTLLENAERVAILGIGSELRGDDDVGLLVLDHLQKNISKQKKSRLSSINSNFNICDEHDVFAGAEPLFGERQRSPHSPLRSAMAKHGRDATPTRHNHTKKTSSSVPHFKLFNGGTAPENLTGEIRRFKPSHLIMIDAVELGKSPGTIMLLDLKNIESTAFLTHKLPVKLMLDYLTAEMNFTTIFIGIQPKSLDFAAPVSKEISLAGRKTADLLLAAFGVEC